MKFGVFSNGQRLRQPELSYEHDLREIVTADRLGFEEVWISEHTGHAWLPVAVAAPDLLICKAAALTQNIRFGPCVRRIALYPPQMVAIEGAVADRLTDGRYMLGFGVGPPVTNYHHWGIDIAQAGDMTAEAIELIERCWQSREPFDFDGRFYHGKEINLFPRPVQARIPIAVASGNERMLLLAAERGFRVLTTWSAPAAAVARIAAAFDTACLSKCGTTRRQDITAARMVYVAATDGQAMADVADNFRELIAYNRRHMEPAASQFKVPGSSPPAMTFENMLEAGNIIVGSPSTVTDAIRKLYRDVGGFGTLLIVGGRDYATPDQIDEMFGRFAREVIPQLQDLDCEDRELLPATGTHNV